MNGKFSNSGFPRTQLELLLVLSVMVIFGCNAVTQVASGIAQDVQGSGNVITQERSVSGFNRVNLGGTGQVLITQGDQEALVVEADDNIMQYIQTDVRGNTLYLGFTAAATGKRIRPSKPIKFSLTMKQVSGLGVSGSGSVSAASIDTDRLDLAISGSGEIDVADLNASTLNADISGSGSLQLAGQAQSQDISISGSGEYNAGKLSSQTVNVSVSGSGDTVVWVTEMLNVQISGSGNVSYYGTPRVQSSSSGSGKIQSLGNP